MQPSEIIQPQAQPPVEQPVVPPQPQPAPESGVPPATQAVDPTEPAAAPFRWQASEYLHHAKGARWYLGLIIGLVLLISVAALTKQWLAIAVFIAMFGAVVVYASKQPRTLTYTLDDKGISIEARSYPFSQFHSFAVIQDVAWHTIDLEPTQRFMPRLTILFEAENLDQIVDRLSAQLPRVDRKPDMIERAARFLHF